MAWQIDPNRTSLAFEVERLGPDVHGMFDRYAVALRPATRPFLAFDLRVEADSLDTGDAELDARLTSDRFLDAARHPIILFTTDDVVPLHDIEDSLADASGDLLLRGVTHPATWRLERNSSAVRAGIETEGVFVATLNLNPAQWGLPHEWPLFGATVRIILRFVAVDAGEFHETGDADAGA